MPDVFISYRRKPSAMLAQLAARELKARGIATFVDTRELDGGGPFPDRLRRAIQGCPVFVCLIADSTFESPWVREEIAYAHRLGKVLIPVFQESYADLNPKPAPPDSHVEYLLRCDGVHVMDVKNIYVDQCMNDLARVIRHSLPRRVPPGLVAGGLVALAALALIVILAVSNGAGNAGRQAGAAVTADTPTSTLRASTAEPTGTPTATATSTGTSTPTPTQIPAVPTTTEPPSATSPSPTLGSVVAEPPPATADPLWTAAPQPGPSPSGNCYAPPYPAWIGLAVGGRGRFVRASSVEAMRAPPANGYFLSGGTLAMPVSGDTFTVLDGPLCLQNEYGGHRWWRIRLDGSGIDGWTPEYVDVGIPAISP